MATTLETYEKLQPGDCIEIDHEVKVGFRTWNTTTIGKVIRCERRRHGVNRSRNFDDKVFSDTILLEREDGERTTITLDEFSTLRVVK